MKRASSKHSFSEPSGNGGNWMGGMGPDLKRMGGMDGNLIGFSLCIRESKGVSFSPPQADFLKLFWTTIQWENNDFHRSSKIFRLTNGGNWKGGMGTQLKRMGGIPAIPPFQRGEWETMLLDNIFNFCCGRLISVLLLVGRGSNFCCILTTPNA